MNADQSPVFRPPAREALESELLCRRCGYLLRGLSTRGNCPECGLPISFSYQGDYLKYSNPRWVGRLMAGAWWTFAALVLTILAVPSAMLLPARSIGVRAVPLWPFLLLATQCFALAGNWLLTSREPVRFTQRVWLPWVARLTRLLEVILATLLFVGSARRFLRIGGVSPIALEMLVVACWMAAQVLEIAVIRRLLIRIPNFALVRWADILIHGLNTFFAMCYGVFVLAFALRRSMTRDPEGFDALLCGLAILAVAACGFMLMAVLFLVRAGKALFREYRRASGAPRVPDN